MTNFNLGPAFPNGLFTSQDHVNSSAGNGNSGNQNYKYASWTDIANAVTPKLLIDPLFDPRTIGAPGTGTPDTTAPQTTIDSGPTDTTGNTSASFTFSANEASTFECSLDAAAYTACTSPKTYTSLVPGSHTGPSGNKTWTFTAARAWAGWLMALRPTG